MHVLTPVLTVDPRSTFWSPDRIANPFAKRWLQAAPQAKSGGEAPVVAEPAAAAEAPAAADQVGLVALQLEGVRTPALWAPAAPCCPTEATAARLPGASQDLGRQKRGSLRLRGWGLFGFAYVRNAG